MGVLGKVTLVVTLTSALVTACSGPSTRHVEQRASRPLVTAPQVPQQQAVGQPEPDRPDRPSDVVLVLMDDFSWNLLPTMRQASDMAREGASYRHSYVVDSLCCVSRTSLLTGQYPHQTGVLTNTPNTPNPFGPVGGYEAYATHGNAERSVNLRLHEAGWTTGLVGKFLNKYYDGSGVVLPEVPPGWTLFQPFLPTAYDGWDFEMLRADADGETLQHVPAPPAGATRAEKDAAYAGTVIADLAVEFVREHRDDRRPYLLVVAPFAPHSRVLPEPHYPGDPRFPPAFADRPRAGRSGNCGPVDCSDLDAARLPGFADDQHDNAPVYADGSPAPQWRPTTAAGPDSAAATARLRDRARMVQSVDRMLARLRRAVGPDTYVVLTSDNGFHLGHHGLGEGKGTPFVSDVRVPLLVTGPGIPPGVRDAVVSNLDLAPTLEELAGLRPARFRSGASLVPSLRDPGADRRRFTFFEHTWAPSLGSDPDANYAGGTMDLIPSYLAVRSRDALLVRYDLDRSWEAVDHAYELYDYRTTRWERTNVFADPAHRAVRDRLLRRLDMFESCLRVTRDDIVTPRCRRSTY